MKSSDKFLISCDIVP